MLTIKGTQVVTESIPNEDGNVVHSEATYYLDLEDAAGNGYLLSTRQSTVEAVEELLNEIKENQSVLKLAQ